MLKQKTPDYIWISRVSRNLSRSENKSRRQWKCVQNCHELDRRMDRGASSFALMATEDRSKIARKNKKISHPYARKGALHTFTSSRAGGALHAISVPLIAPQVAAVSCFLCDCNYFITFFQSILALQDFCGILGKCLLMKDIFKQSNYC